jgi:hypothetical protein
MQELQIKKKRKHHKSVWEKYLKLKINNYTKIKSKNINKKEKGKRNISNW